MAYERSKKTIKKRPVFLIISTVVLIGIIVVSFYVKAYKPAEMNDKIYVQFKEALLNEDIAFFQERVEYHGEQLTRAEALNFVNWLNEEKSIRGDAISEVAKDRADRTQGMEATGLFRLLDTGKGRFGFTDYKLELLPQTLSVTTDMPLTNVWIDGVQSGRIEEPGEVLSLEQMPGRYDVKAVAVVDGSTVTKEETVRLTEATGLSFVLRPEKSETIAGQFNLERTELIETEVEAITGHSIETIDSLLRKKRERVIERIGEPLERDGDKWSYDNMTVTFQKDRVGQIDIDLNKRPDDLVALLGEPIEKSETDTGTEWRYDRTLFESFFTLLKLQSEKQFIDQDGAIHLILS